MSRPEVTGGLLDGGSYRVTAYSLVLLSPDARVAEELDLDRVREVGRDGNAVSLRLQDGTTRIFTCATIDDAGRLQDALRQHAPPVSQVPLPPATQQNVEVTTGSRPSPLGVIVGVALLILVVFLAIIAIRALTDDGDDADADPNLVPATEPTPTETPQPTPTEPEIEAEPTESGRLPARRLGQGAALNDGTTRLDRDDASTKAIRERDSA